MSLRSTEHLENRKMYTYTRKTAYMFFLYFTSYNWSTKKTEPTVLFKTEPTVFLKTELEKSIPHIPKYEEFEVKERR